MEEYRGFQVTLISASDLKDVRRVGEMKTYAKVSISGNSGSEWTTPVDKERKTDPYWNCKLQYSVPEEDLRQEGGENLVITLYCKRSLSEDKYVGELKLSLKKLFDNGLARENLEYDVVRNDAEGTFGTLKLSYSFGASTEKKNVQNTQTGPGDGRRRRTFLEYVSVLADSIQIGEALS